jgi:hypothetical protein
MPTLIAMTVFLTFIWLKALSALWAGLSADIDFVAAACAARAKKRGFCPLRFVARSSLLVC